jgi:flagellar motor switch protein FliM
MTEILSQDEIDALLSAISTGEVDIDEFIEASSEQKKIKIYDFRRPDKFSKDHIRTLQMIHETFARLATTSLSGQLRGIVGMHVSSVDQLTYEEFIRSIPNPTTLSVINMDPLMGSVVLEIDPSITFTIIDKILGGLGEATKINRELTDIELSVMEGLIVRINGNLREAWSGIIDLRPMLANIETNPQFAQIVPPNDMIVLITLETKIEDVEGMVNLCIPYVTIEPLLGKLTAQYWYHLNNAVCKEPVQTESIRKTNYKRHIIFNNIIKNMNYKELSKIKTGSRLVIKKDNIKQTGYEYLGTDKEVSNG